MSKKKVDANKRARSNASSSVALFHARFPMPPVNGLESFNVVGPVQDTTHRLEASLDAHNTPAGCSSTALNENHKQDGEEGHRCLEPGCKYGKAFARKTELDRHVASKHRSKRPFRCIVKGCFKGQKSPAFPRADKLTAHIRATHSSGSVMECPSPKCGVTLPLDLLGVHLRHSRTHEYRPWDLDSRLRSTEISQSKRLLLDQSRALLNASGTERTRCPYWRCSKQLPLSSLVEHILSHSHEEHIEMEEALNGRNYAFVRTNCIHTTDTFLEGSC